VRKGGKKDGGWGWKKGGGEGGGRGVVGGGGGCRPVGRMCGVLSVGGAGGGGVWG